MSERKIPTWDEASMLWALPDRAERWANATFPGHTVDDIFKKIIEEDEELQYAVDYQTANEVMEEAADGIILRMRLISKLGGDPWRVVLEKFAEVEAREYVNGQRVRK